MPGRGGRGGPKSHLFRPYCALVPHQRHDAIKNDGRNETYLYPCDGDEIVHCAGPDKSKIQAYLGTFEVVRCDGVAAVLWGRSDLCRRGGP